MAAPSLPHPARLTKAEARAWARSNRASRPPEEVTALSHLACRHALDFLINTLPNVREGRANPGRVMMTYAPIPGKGEADPSPLIQALVSEGLIHDVAIPIVTGPIESGGAMEAYPISSMDPIQHTPQGLPILMDEVHPIPVADLGLVIVPMLAGDMLGHRVGYGKGYYDRFLARLGPGVLTIGLCLEPPLERLIDIDPWDRPLTAIAYPGGITHP